MHFVEFMEVNVRSLDDFDLSDLHVLDGINRGHFLGNSLFNHLTGEEVKDSGDVSLCDFLGNDIVNSLADNLLLGSKGIVSLALLVGGLSGESNNKDTKDISVLSLDIGDGLDQSFSLLDEGAKLVPGGINTIERSQSLSSFGLINNEFNLSPVEAILVGSEVSLHLGDDSAFDAILDFF